MRDSPGGRAGAVFHTARRAGAAVYSRPRAAALALAILVTRTAIEAIAELAGVANPLTKALTAANRDRQFIVELSMVAAVDVAAAIVVGIVARFAIAVA